MSLSERDRKIKKMVPEEVILPLSQCCGKPIIHGHCMGCLRPAELSETISNQSIPEEKKEITEKPFRKELS